jgi:hypothetical protein
MSKRDFKKYLQELTKEELEAQMIALYDKFSDVKVYYDFVFRPNEEKLVQEAKVKISNEYFPIKSRKAKGRRSTAQKIIKHFISLGVDSFRIADLMLFALEIAQTYSSDKIIRQEVFFKSMFSSYQQAVGFMISPGILSEFKNRVEAIEEEAVRQEWFNHYEFSAVLERLAY